ncbi:MAG: amino acid aminotransferase [Sphingomicrobium sp.]
MLTTTRTLRLSDLEPVKSDSLLALIAMANADIRPDKIDVGVGVYKDGSGATPILRSVKVAEKRLWEQQTSKSYLGSAGDPRFTELIGEIVFGGPLPAAIKGVQTPGGCGALSLAFKLVAALNPDARVLIGTPTWPNHQPIVAGCGLEIVEYPYYDRDTQSVRFDAMVAALEAASPGDAVLLHGCCHNPTGADLDESQWAEVTRLMVERELLPVVDIAYQGLGDGLEADAAGLRGVIAACGDVLVAQSCDKNFGVYRDRVGNFFIKSDSEETSAKAMARVLQLARESWSMPPDHGAAAIRIVLDDAELRADWLAELGEMLARIHRIRSKLAAAHPSLAYIGAQKGMFSMLPLSRDQVVKLRKDEAIYMADSGRFNVLGMSDEAVDRFVTAVIGVIG